MSSPRSIARASPGPNPASATTIALAVSRLALGLAVLGLAFRSLIWGSWLPEPGDPYGLADVLELLIFYALVALCAVCVVLGMIVALRTKARPASLGGRLLAIGLLTPVVYYFLHPLMPIFRLW